MGFRAQARIVELTLELAQLRVKPIIDREKEGALMGREEEIEQLNAELTRLRSQLEEANKKRDSFERSFDAMVHHFRVMEKRAETAEAANQRLVEALKDILADQSIDWIMGGRIQQIAEKAVKEGTKL